MRRRHASTEGQKDPGGSCWYHSSTSPTLAASPASAGGALAGPGSTADGTAAGAGHQI